MQAIYSQGVYSRWWSGCCKASLEAIWLLIEGGNMSIPPSRIGKRRRVDSSPPFEHSLTRNEDLSHLLWKINDLHKVRRWLQSTDCVICSPWTMSGTVTKYYCDPSIKRAGSEAGSRSRSYISTSRSNLLWWLRLRRQMLSRYFTWLHGCPFFCQVMLFWYASKKLMR